MSKEQEKKEGDIGDLTNDLGKLELKTPPEKEEEEDVEKEKEKEEEKEEEGVDNLKVKSESLRIKTSGTRAEVIVLDFEAFSPLEHFQRNAPSRENYHIWEFAASNMSGTFVFESLVRIGKTLQPDEGKYPWTKARERGINLEDSQHPSFQDAWAEFVLKLNAFLQSKKEDTFPIFVAHNGDCHDFLILKAELARNKLDVPDVLVLDSLPLFRSTFPGLDSHSRDYLFELFSGGTQPKSHSALADAKGLVQLLFVSLGHMKLGSYQAFCDFCHKKSQILKSDQSGPLTPKGISFSSTSATSGFQLLSSAPSPSPSPSAFSTPSAFPTKSTFSTPSAFPTKPFFSTPSAFPTKSTFSTPSAFPTKPFFSTPSASPTKSAFSTPSAFPTKSFFSTPSSQSSRISPGALCPRCRVGRIVTRQNGRTGEFFWGCSAFGSGKCHWTSPC